MLRLADVALDVPAFHTQEAAWKAVVWLDTFHSTKQKRQFSRDRHKYLGLLLLLLYYLASGGTWRPQSGLGPSGIYIHCK